MKSIAYFIAGMIAMGLISTAEARRHHRGEAHCRVGQILVRHTGACISRTSAMRDGIISIPRPSHHGHGRQRLIEYASVEPPPRPPHRPMDPTPPPEVKCKEDDAGPDPTGWPGNWVRNMGLPQYHSWRN